MAEPEPEPEALDAGAGSEGAVYAMVGAGFAIVMIVVVGYCWVDRRNMKRRYEGGGDEVAEATPGYGSDRSLGDAGGGDGAESASRAAESEAAGTEYSPRGSSASYYGTETTRLVGDNIHRSTMSIHVARLECQVSKMINSDTCPRPTTGRQPRARGAWRRAGRERPAVASAAWCVAARRCARRSVSLESRAHTRPCHQR